jgi:hypothetical protein
MLKKLTFKGDFKNNIGFPFLWPSQNTQNTPGTKTGCQKYQQPPLYFFNLVRFQNEGIITHHIRSFLKDTANIIHLLTKEALLFSADAPLPSRNKLLMQNNVFAFPILTGFNCPVQP